MRAVAKPQERLTRAHERLWPPFLPIVRTLLNEAKGIVLVRVGVYILIVMDTIPRDTHLCSVRGVRAVQQRKALVRDNHLHDPALDESVQAKALAQRGVDVWHARQARF